MAQYERHVIGWQEITDDNDPTWLMAVKCATCGRFVGSKTFWVKDSTWDGGRRPVTITTHDDGSPYFQPYGAGPKDIA